jgi:4-amino-4-deoxy-L-arabinose transferase-like glycosyltransferase
MQLPSINIDRNFIYLSGIILLFVFFCLTVIYEYPPVWPDETLFADTAYELAFHERLATPVWSYVAEGMGERAVWYPPVHFMLLALAYKFFGFGILQTRLVSLLFGVVSIIALFAISTKLTGGDRRIPVFIVALLAIDPVFIRGAIIGRGDIIAVAFMLLGFLCFVSQHKGLVKYFSSGFFMGLSALTHLFGVMGFFAVFVLSFFERHSIIPKRMRLLLLGLPFFTLLFFWGAYALQDVNVFLKQFSGQIGEKATTQASDTLFLNFFIKPYFFLAPTWLKNAVASNLLLLVYVLLFLGFLAYLMKNMRDWNSVSVGVFLLSSVIFYTLGRHGMWYNTYIQPFLYLAVGLIVSRGKSIAPSSRIQRTFFAYVIPASVITLIAFNVTVDCFILWKNSQPPTDYFDFSYRILDVIPEDSTLLIASSPDPYFVLKDAGKNLRLYTFVHMGSYPMEASYKRILPDIDYFIFSGTPEKHFMSLYDVRVLDDFIRDNASVYNVVGDGGEYSAVIYKVRKPAW